MPLLLFSARKYQINPSSHRPGSPVSTDSNMSMAAVHRRPPKKQKQHPAGHPGNQRREAYNEGNTLIHLSKQKYYQYFKQFSWNRTQVGYVY